jgi:uncharacterized membrane protein
MKRYQYTLLGIFLLFLSLLCTVGKETEAQTAMGIFLALVSILILLTGISRETGE